MSLESPKTSIPSIAQTLSLLLLVFLLMLVLSALMLGLFNSEPNSISASSIAVTVFASMSLSYLVLVFVSRPYWQQYFIPQLKQQTNWSLGSLIIGVCFALFIQSLQQQFPPAEGIETSIQQALVGSQFSVLLLYISVIFIAPFFEEYLFRGILFDSLKKQWGLAVAVLLSAFIFTLFHLFEYYQYWLGWVAVFSLAIILAIVRHKSQSMLNPILIHAAYNTTLMLAASN